MTMVTRSHTRPQPYLFCATLQKIAHDRGIFSFYDLLMIASTNKASRKELLSQWYWQVFILKRCIYKKIFQSDIGAYNCIKTKSKVYEQEQSYYKDASVLAKLLLIYYKTIPHSDCMKDIRQEILEWPQKADRYSLASLLYFYGHQRNSAYDVLVSSVQKSNFPNALDVALELESYSYSSLKQLFSDIPEWNPEVEEQFRQFSHRFKGYSFIKEDVKCFVAVKCAEGRTHESIDKAMKILASTENFYEKDEALVKVAQVQAQIDGEDSAQKALQILDLVQDRFEIEQGLNAIAQIRAQKNDENAICEARQIADRINDHRLRNTTLKWIDACSFPIDSRIRLTKTLEICHNLSSKQVVDYLDKRANQSDARSIEDALKVSYSYFNYSHTCVVAARAKKQDSRAFSAAIEMDVIITPALVLTRLDRENNAAGLRKAIEMCDLAYIFYKVDSLLKLADRCKREHLPRFEDPLNVVRDLINLVSTDIPPTRRTRHFDLTPSYEEQDAAIHIQKRRRVRK